MLCSVMFDYMRNLDFVKMIQSKEWLAGAVRARCGALLKAKLKSDGEWATGTVAQRKADEVADMVRSEVEEILSQV